MDRWRHSRSEKVFELRIIDQGCPVSNDKYPNDRFYLRFSLSLVPPFLFLHLSIWNDRNRLTGDSQPAGGNAEPGVTKRFWPSFLGFWFRVSSHSDSIERLRYFHDASIGFAINSEFAPRDNRATAESGMAWWRAAANRRTGLSSMLQYRRRRKGLPTEIARTV